MNVTVDAAFASSFKIAKGVLDGALEAGRGSRAEIDLRRDFITPTLAQFCQEWFGLPDQAFVVAGGWNWDPVGDPTPRCPGDFMAPSRYCFYPDPIPAIAKYGRDQGKRLTAAAERYFAQLRKMKQPQGGLAAEMLKFKALRNDNNLLARTLIGIMVGMLPPTDGNLRAILYEWLEEKTFWRHQQSLAAASGYKEPNLVAAIESLEGPLKRAMQKRPAPDLLWRTAKKADTLGTVNVEPGDKIILAIVSATLEKYNDENNDVYAVFGGNRRGVEPPTHACPAYNMAMGAMLGILAALLSSGQIEALRAPLLVRLVR
jgi:cytochrome P450